MGNISARNRVEELHERLDRIEAIASITVRLQHDPDGIDPYEALRNILFLIDTSKA